MAETVVLKKCASYDLPEMEKQILSGLELLGGLDNFIKTDEKVLIKVNCLFPSEPEKAVITHPLFLQAVVRIIKKKNKKYNNRRFAGVRQFYFRIKVRL